MGDAMTDLDRLIERVEAWTGTERLPHSRKGRGMIRCIVSWSLYWIGDLIQRLNDRALDRVGLWNLPMFRAYQAVMRDAVRVQGDGKGPWRPVAGTTSKEDSE